MIRYIPQYRVTGKNGMEIFRSADLNKAIDFCAKAKQKRPYIGARVQRRFKRVYNDHESWSEWEWC